MRMIDTSLVVLFGAVAVEAMQIVKISSCYDGDTSRTSTGEKIRLACIDTPELRGCRSDPIPAPAAWDHLRGMVVGYLLIPWLIADKL